MPVILGVDSPQYTQSELDAFRKENAQGVTWEGRHMTGYEATQYQNRIERGIRTQKHRVLMSEAAGDGEQLLHDRVKLTRLNQEYAGSTRPWASRAGRNGWKWLDGAALEPRKNRWAPSKTIRSVSVKSTSKTSPLPRSPLRG